MKEKFCTFLLVLYVVGAVGTFGHALNHVPKANPPSPDEPKPIFVTFGSILWPFYWSWYLER